MVRPWFGLLLAVLLSVGWKTGAAPPIEAYGELPAMDMMTLSPSGERFAYVEADGEKRRLVALAIDKKPLLDQPLGTVKVRGLEWAGDDHIMVISTNTTELPFEFLEHKQELSTVVVFDLANRKMMPVFGQAHEERIANVVLGYYGTRQVDGHWCGYFGGITYKQRIVNGSLRGAFDHGFPDLYRVDLDTGETEIVSPGRDYIDDWLVNPKGDVVARSFSDSRQGRWWIESLGEGGKTIAGGHFDLGGAGGLYPGHTADTILADVPNG